MKKKPYIVNPQTHRLVPDQLKFFKSFAPSGDPNEGVRLAIAKLRKINRAYPENMPVPTRLTLLLEYIGLAIAGKEWEKLESYQEEIAEALADLESWASEQAFSEAIAEGTIAVGDSYII